MNQWITTIATIASAIAAIASVFVAIIVGRNQKKYEKRSQDIELFNQRYEIYKDFMRVFQYSSFVQEETQFTILRRERTNNLYILSMILVDYELPSGNNFESEYREIQQLLTEGGNSDELRALSRECNLEQQIKKELEPIQVALETKMRSAEFLFSKEITVATVEYVSALFEYMIPFSKGTNNFNKLVTTIDRIKNMRIIEEMRSTIDFSIKE